MHGPNPMQVKRGGDEGMKINKKDIAKVLQGGRTSLKSLLFYGEDEGWVLPEVEHCTKILNVSPHNIQTISGEDILQKKVFLSDMLLTPSLFGATDFIIVTRATDKIVPILKEIFVQGDIPSLFIVQAASYLLPSSKLRNLYEIETYLGAIPCYAPDISSITARVKSLLQEHGKSISDTTARHIASLFAEDVSLLPLELEKLSLYMGGRIQVAEEDIIRVLSPFAQETLQEITDAFLSKQHPLLAEKTEAGDILSNPAAVIRGLLSALIRLHQAKALLVKEHTIDQVMRMVSPAVFFKEKEAFARYLKLWSVKELEGTILQLVALEADCKIKSRQSEDLLRRFLFAFIV